MNFESQLRSNILKAAEDMHRGGTRFASFRTAKCNEKYWHLTNQGGFLLRKGVTPADGIRDIFTDGKKYAFECAVAIVILLYKAVLDTIGEQKFNELFPNLLLYSWNYDSDLGLTTRNTDSAFARPGDVLYFKNPDVDPDHMEWQGENVIKMGTDSYYGHGLGIRSAEDMIKALNKRRIPGASESAYLLDQISYPDYAYLSQFAPADSRSFQPLWLPVTAQIGGLQYRE
ncbi:protein-glutamine gamma-glutamyltransferase [Paenibacillus gansuensis]|uniref:Protein-glutamine gamma-glutamyltransferase n=1 Tax=Paenibacillus gansuensis TaxID=306542 RepID=A0ABW5P7G8_9BACL